MNAKQIQYALALEKVRSFSVCAEQLGITQPSLSKQIQNLESELGIKLFDRGTVPMTITPAGSYFLREAQNLLYLGGQLVESMEEFKQGHRGSLTIGMSPFRNLHFMPRFIQLFRQKYPGVQICLHEATSDQLRKNAAEGKYDLAIINLPVNDAVLDIVPLEPERLVVAVPNRMLRDVTFEGDTLPAEVDFSIFQNIPFVVVASSQEMRRYFDSLCAACGICPQIVVEVSGGVSSTWAMARAGIGAALLPLQFVSSEPFEQNITLFPIKGSQYIRQPVIVTRRGQYLSEYAQYAIDLLVNSFEQKHKNSV